MHASDAPARWSASGVVRKLGSLLLASAWVIQAGGLAYHVDSDPYRPVARDAVRLVPDDPAYTQAIQNGSLVVEVKASRFTSFYSYVIYFAFLSTTLGILALRWSEAAKPANPVANLSVGPPASKLRS